MIYETYSVGGVLYHHGILGQKHGVRNGPPYPLDENDHSAREKKDGWEKSLGKRGESHHDSIYERYRNKKAKKRFEKNYKKITKIDKKKDAHTSLDEASSKTYTKMLDKAKVSDDELKKYKKLKDRYEKTLDEMVYHEDDPDGGKKYLYKYNKAVKDYEKYRAELAKKVIGDYREVKSLKDNKYSVADQWKELQKSGIAKRMRIDEKYLKKRLKY